MLVPEEPYKPVAEAEQLQHERNTGESRCSKQHDAWMCPFVSEEVSGWLACVALQNQARSCINDVNYFIKVAAVINWGNICSLKYSKYPPDCSRQMGGAPQQAGEMVFSFALEVQWQGYYAWMYHCDNTPASQWLIPSLRRFVTFVTKPQYQMPKPAHTSIVIITWPSNPH